MAGRHAFFAQMPAVAAFALSFLTLTLGCAPRPDGPAAPATIVPTDARSLLHEAIATLASNSLGRERVDWRELELSLAVSLEPAAPQAAAHGAIVAAVAALGDPHARFTPPPSPAPAPSPGAPGGVVASPARATSVPPIPTLPEAVVLPDSAAYLLIPGCHAADAEGLLAFSSRLEDEIARVSAGRSRDAGTAWVIDLRLNGGGNMWPMLLGLRPLLGDGVQMAMLHPDLRRADFGLSPDAAWIDWRTGTGPEPQLRRSAGTPAVLINAPRIAVLLGPWTLSSGEALAVCLAGRDGDGAAVRTFGEPTGGLTTVTNTFPLSDGSTLNLPVAQMAGRDGRPVPVRLTPDRPIEFSTWPGPDDAVARAARAWALAQH